MNDILQPSAPQNAQKNPWMMSTLVLVGLIVGFGIGQLPFFDRGESGRSTVSQGTSQGDSQAPTQQPTSPEDYEKLTEALLDDDTIIGDEDAPVTVVEFSDFQCPFCQAAAGVENEVYAALKQRDPSWVPPVPDLLKTYVKDGKVRFIYRDFPISSHPQAQISAEAAECADEQGKFLEMHDKVFAGYQEWSGNTAGAKDVLKGYAKVLGLNTGKFDECLDSGKYAAEVQKDLQDGSRAGVTGTPTFYVNGREVSGAQSFTVLSSLIDSLLE